MTQTVTRPFFLESSRLSVDAITSDLRVQVSPNDWIMLRIVQFPPTVTLGGRRPLVIQAVAYDSPMNWAEPVFSALEDYLAGLGEHVVDFTVLVDLSALVGPFELAWFLWAFIVEDGRLVDDHIQPLLNEEMARVEDLISPAAPRLQPVH